MMPWRMATLNLEQNHKRWDARRELVIDQLAGLQPDVVALNEICLPLQTGRCIDYIWVAGPLAVRASGVCFNTPSATDLTLWPSDHAGVWADLTFV
jgi:endonuclease/exonuclease/phosphatase family metal-dependent hydrolase